jgi:hypothetical protein
MTIINLHTANLSRVKFIKLLNEVEGNIDTVLDTALNTALDTDTILNLKLKLNTKIHKKLDIIKLCDKLYDTNELPTLDYSKKSTSKLLDELEHNTANILNTTPHTTQRTTQRITSQHTTNDKLITKEKALAKYYDNLNKTLGTIVHNIYVQTDYNVIMSNVPISGTLSETNHIEDITPHHIYDTLTNFADSNDIVNVLQIANDTYLINIRNNNTARYLINKLNGKLLDSNVIHLSYIEQPCNNTSRDTSYMSSSGCGVPDVPGVPGVPGVSSTVKNNEKKNTVWYTIWYDKWQEWQGWQEWKYLKPILQKLSKWLG